MQKFITAIAAILLLSSCEKEISLPYRSVEPLYVIEGRITNETTEVLLSRTLDMDDGIMGYGIPHAKITLIGEDGTFEELQYVSGGYYRPARNLTGSAGNTYTLKVDIDGESYTSFSRMHGGADIDELYFRWLEVMKERILFCTVTFSDIEGEDNYYCYRIRRNGENYRWNVLTDRGYDGRQITVDIVCMSEKAAKENKKDDWKDILYENDNIELEIQTIDRRTYDYLYSLGLSERTAANPIDNFEGGCLGYFSAYTSARHYTVFSYKDIREY